MAVACTRRADERRCEKAPGMAARPSSVLQLALHPLRCFGVDWHLGASGVNRERGGHHLRIAPGSRAMLASMRREWRLVASLGACVALGWAAATGGCEERAPQLSLAHDKKLSGRLAARNAQWPAACARAPEERVGLPPALSMAPERALRLVPADLVQDMVDVVRHLPAPFDELFRRHVCAVVWMHGAPMTGTLRLLAGDDAHGIILLNVDNLQSSPDEWLSFKEASVFEPNPEREIRGTMTAPGEERRTVLLEFLLVHELAHVLDAVFPADPLVAEFKRVSWPRRDPLASAKTLHYARDRGGQPLADAQLEAYFDVTTAGAFSDPSATDNSMEDFAESLSSYVHGVLRRRPWKLEAWRRGQLVRSLSLCWGQARCAEKQRILEQLLLRWGSAD
jgi:hypothetical protein